MPETSGTVSKDRLVTEIPVRTYEKAAEYASRGDITMTAYFQKGHGVYYDLAKRGLLKPGNIIRMWSQSHPIPPLMTYPDLSSPATEETKRLVLDRPARTAPETAELIAVSDVRTKTAYAIATLNLLNGLIDIRDSIDPDSQLKFSVGSMAGEQPPRPITYWITEV
jgi:hypothetical protein